MDDEVPAAGLSVLECSPELGDLHQQGCGRVAGWAPRHRSSMIWGCGIWGCERLTDGLMEHGLLDEYRALGLPVIRGEGQRLFREASQPPSS
ncbi:hypothetical protein [Pseudonocardia sp.]|uniref:hypothetical protein n=1 Tax=Pseudonocardia sp. TaxID=60912 RepID=UPI0031FC9C39